MVAVGVGVGVVVAVGVAVGVGVGVVVAVGVVVGVVAAVGIATVRNGGRMFPERDSRRPIWTHGVYKEAVVLGPVDDGPPVGKRGAGLWPQHASAHYQQRIPPARAQRARFDYLTYTRKHEGPCFRHGLNGITLVGMWPLNYQPI